MTEIPAACHYVDGFLGTSHFFSTRDEAQACLLEREQRTGEPHFISVEAQIRIAVDVFFFVNACSDKPMKTPDETQLCKLSRARIYLDTKVKIPRR